MIFLMNKWACKDRVSQQLLQSIFDCEQAKQAQNPPWHRSSEGKNTCDGLFKIFEMSSYINEY
jgi:hypothetical protein